MIDFSGKGEMIKSVKEGLMEELIFKLRLKNECDGAR